MITRQDMFDPLLEALPSFRPAWERFIEEWTPRPGRYSELKPGEYPSYLLLGDLAGHLGDLFERGELDEVRKALAVAERWLLEGEHYVKEAASVGLLEDLQNVAQRRNLPEDGLYALLGLEGKFWWDKVNAFWSKGEILADERLMTPSDQQQWKLDSAVAKAAWDRARKK